MNEWFDIAILALDATMRVSAPLILAALAGLFSERAGVVDISLEGKMLAGGFAAAAAASVTGSAWLGLGAAILVSLALALLHGFACITHRGNQVVSGVAINILAAGLTMIMGLHWFNQGGQTPRLDNEARFLSLDLPGAQAVADVPYINDPPIHRWVISTEAVKQASAFTERLRRDSVNFGKNRNWAVPTAAIRPEMIMGRWDNPADQPQDISRAHEG